MTVTMTPPSSASMTSQTNMTSKQLLFLHRIVKFLSVIRLIRSLYGKSLRPPCCFPKRIRQNSRVCYYAYKRKVSRVYVKGELRSLSLLFPSLFIYTTFTVNFFDCSIYNGSVSDRTARVYFCTRIVPLFC